MLDEIESGERALKRVSILIGSELLVANFHELFSDLFASREHVGETSVGKVAIVLDIGEFFHVLSILEAVEICHVFG